LVPYTHPQRPPLLPFLKNINALLSPLFFILKIVYIKL
jgi:hypothetical protein